MEILLSEYTLPLVAPTRLHAKTYDLSTDEHCRTAFYSHENRIRNDGRCIVPTNTRNLFYWVPSPSFGILHRQPSASGTPQRLPYFCTTSLRTEFIMITYAYVMVALRTITEQFRLLLKRKGNVHITKDDASEMKEMSKRMYELYTIIKEVLTPSVSLCVMGQSLPLCPELSVQTCNALMCIVRAFHTIITFTTLEMAKTKKGDKVKDSTSAAMCMHISLMFYEAYSILTKCVWPYYIWDSPSYVATERTALQQYLMGNGHFYMIRAHLFAYRQQTSCKDGQRAMVQLCLLRRAYYLIRILSEGSFLGFHDASTVLKGWVIAQINNIRQHWTIDPAQEQKIETPEQYDAIERHILHVLDKRDARHLLKMHIKIYGPHFISDHKYCTLTSSFIFTGHNE